jgi:hypothetical protein
MENHGIFVTFCMLGLHRVFKDKVERFPFFKFIIIFVIFH